MKIFSTENQDESTSLLRLGKPFLPRGMVTIVPGDPFQGPMQRGGTTLLGLATVYYCVVPFSAPLSVGWIAA